MERDQMQLNNIATQFDRKANQHPGLGMILLVFDDIERVKKRTNIAIVIKGVKAEDAVRMMREMADMIERSERPDPASKIVVPGGLIVPGKA